MVNNQKDNSDPKANMALLKQQYNKEAEFISKEGFPFNAFDEQWVLSGLGNKGQSVDLSWLHNSKFSLEDQIHLRLTLANMSALRSKSTISNVIGVISTNQLNSLSVVDFKLLWVTLDKIKKSRFSSLILWLYKHDTEIFNDLYQWKSNLNNETVSVKITDPEKGSLSDLENHALNVAMNMKSKKLIERGFEVTHTKENKGLGLLSSFRNFIASRMVQVLLRRPSNLIQLKWRDISPDASIFDSDNIFFSDDDELKIRMFKAKSKGTFRQYPESEPLTLNNAISKEIIFYRTGYLKLFNQALINQGIKLNDDELYDIFQNLPFLFVDALFKTKFKDKNQLCSSFNSDASGFHSDSFSVGSSVRDLFESLKITSERLPQDKFNIGNNRLRHTIATNAARDNLGLLIIAKLLGNTPSSAKIYIDLSDEARVQINEKFIANDFLVNAFSTSVSELMKSGEIAIEDDLGDTFGKSKNVNQCTGCQRSKPLGCYGCNSFSALVSGDHRSQRDKAQQKYDYRINSGDAPHALLELKKQIRYIEATIAACDQVMQRKIGEE